MMPGLVAVWVRKERENWIRHLSRLGFTLGLYIAFKGVGSIHCHYIIKFLHFQNVPCIEQEVQLQVTR